MTIISQMRIENCIGSELKVDYVEGRFIKGCTTNFTFLKCIVHIYVDCKKLASPFEGGLREMFTAIRTPIPSPSLKGREQNLDKSEICRTPL